jgi:DNA-binding CsgD family transcriptional regulator
MKVQLSARELADLEHANTVLLSPFAYQSSVEWGHAACLAVQVCSGADASVFGLFVPGEDSVAGEPDVVRAMHEIMPPPEWLRDGLIDRRRRAHLDVADWHQMFDTEVVRRTAFYNDVVRPRGLLAPIHMMAETGQSELPAICAVLYSDEDRADRNAESRKAVLRLLYPAFRAGLDTFLGYRSRHSALRSVADSASFGMVFFSGDGVMQKANAYFEQLMSADPDRGLIRARIGHIVRGLLSGSYAERLPDPHRSNLELRTRAAHYRITATIMENQWSHGAESVLALIERVESETIQKGGLAERFSLTQREIEVALLLRTGRSTRQIATELDISINTARRHIERILLKLDVHNRTAAVARLVGEQATTATVPRRLS